MSTDTVFSVGSEDCRLVCCILPTAFVTVLSWVERKWNVSVIRRVFLPRHVDKKGAVQPVAPQQLLWLWALWVLLWWVLLLSLRVQLLWPPGPDCRFQIQAAPCPLLEAFPQMPPAQAPSLSVTRKVVLTVTVTVNENPAAQ